MEKLSPQSMIATAVLAAVTYVGTGVVKWVWDTTQTNQELKEIKVQLKKMDEGGTDFSKKLLIEVRELRVLTVQNQELIISALHPDEYTQNPAKKEKRNGKEGKKSGTVDLGPGCQKPDIYYHGAGYDSRIGLAQRGDQDCGSSSSR